jgi:hypothetical protein
MLIGRRGLPVLALRMLTPLLESGCRSATILLSVAALLAACSTDDSLSSNGPSAGASGQAQGGALTSGGGTNAVGGAAAGSGGAVTSFGGAVAAGGTSSTAGGEGVSCSQSKVICNMITPSCPAMQVPELNANGNCYTGDCIPIGSCACQAATDCPDNDQYTCNNGTKRCTPYLI